MDVHILARHCKLSQDEHDVAVKAAEHLLKFHEDIIRVDIVATEDAGRKGAEFSVHVQGQTILASEHATEHSHAIHGAREKVERQLRKINERKLAARNTATSH